MVDAWQHRCNDSSFDKNDVGSGSWEYHLNVANDATAPWLESGRAVIVRRFSEAAAASFADEFFDFICEPSERRKCAFSFALAGP